MIQLQIHGSATGLCRIVRMCIFTRVLDTVVATKAIAERPAWAEERHLREWLTAGGRARRGRDGFAVQCEDGRLSVAVDQRILQVFRAKLLKVGPASLPLKPNLLK